MVDGPGGRWRTASFGARLGVITAGALLLRIVVTVVTKGADGELLDEGDGLYYSLSALSFRYGNAFHHPFTGQPMADHAPLTTIVLVPAGWFESTLGMRLTMVLLSSLAVAVIGLVGRQVGGPRVGLWAAGLAAASPALWVDAPLVMSESLVALLVASLLFATYRLWRRPSLGGSLVLGLLLGLLVLARAEYVLLGPFLVAPAILRVGAWSWPRRLATVVGAGAVAVACVAPWSLWATSQFPDRVLVSTNEGLTLGGANCPDTYHGDNIGYWTLACALDGTTPDQGPSEVSAQQRAKGLAYARAHLGDLPRVVLAREGRTFGFYAAADTVASSVHEGRSEPMAWLAYVASWIILPPAVAGVVVLRRRRARLSPLLVVAALPVVVSAAFNGLPRHRLPLDLVACVLAGAAIAAVQDRRSEAALRPSTV